MGHCDYVGYFGGPGSFSVAQNGSVRHQELGPSQLSSKSGDVMFPGTTETSDLIWDGLQRGEHIASGVYVYGSSQKSRALI